MSTEQQDIPPLSDEQFRHVYNRLVDTARESFVSWLYFMHPQQPGQHYVIEPFHRYLAELVQRVYDDERGPRQSVSVPPQHGKSQLLCVRAVAWLVGKQPGINIAMTGYSQSLLNDFLRDVKEIVASSQYQEVFGEIEPADGYNRANAVMFTNGSNVQCRGAGSKLVGRPVDWLIIDDPHPGRFEAEQAGQRKKVEDWYHGDCRSRLSEGAKVFIISTRWHPDDLHGVLMDPERVARLQARGMAHINFEATNLTAICDDEENDPLGRSEGDVLAPRLKSVQFMNETREETPDYEWSSQYMGRPVSITSGVIDLDNVKEIGHNQVPWDRLTMICRGWDLATSEKDAADFSAGVLMGYDKNTDEVYVLDVWRKKLMWPKTKPLAVALAHRDQEDYGVGRIGVEGVAGFLACVQDLRHELGGKVRVEKCNPKSGGKLMRALPWLNKMEAGRFYIVRAPWNRDYLAELRTFPDPKFHDDQVDATSIAWEMVSKMPARLLIA